MWYRLYVDLVKTVAGSFTGNESGADSNETTDGYCLAGDSCPHALDELSEF